MYVEKGTLLLQFGKQYLQLKLLKNGVPIGAGVNMPDLSTIYTWCGEKYILLNPEDTILAGDIGQWKTEPIIDGVLTTASLTILVSGNHKAGELSNCLYFRKLDTRQLPDYKSNADLFKMLTIVNNKLDLLLRHHKRNVNTVLEDEERRLDSEL